MKKIFYVFCFIVLRYLPTMDAQNCSFNDTDAVETVNDAYLPNSNSLIYTVRLNLHVMQKDDSSGNFQNTTTDKAYLQQMFDDVNTIYSANQQPVWNGPQNDPYLPDTRIRFRIDGIYFHRNSAVCHLKPYNESTGSDVYFNQYGVNIDHSINIFFVELLYDNGTPYIIRAGNGFGLNGEDKNCVGLYSLYYGYLNDPSGSRYLDPRLIAHELGHGLGLKHTMASSGKCDELSDTYCPDVAVVCNYNTDVNCSNNMMKASSIVNTHKSPRQMGKMRRLMTVG